MLREIEERLYEHCSQAIMKISPKSEPALELHSRAAPSVEAHQRINGPNTGRNSRGRRIKEMMLMYEHVLKSTLVVVGKVVLSFVSREKPSSP